MDLLLKVNIFFLIPFTFLLGFYFSIRLKWPQVRGLGQTLKALVASGRGRNAFSSFSALSAVLGGNLGVGNIAGVAVALQWGGPGSIVWMWIMAVLASAIKFVSCGLGIVYRTSSTKGYHAGPMYYIDAGLKRPWMGKLFATATVLTAFSVGNLVQVNSIHMAWASLVPDWVLVVALVAFLVAVFRGGTERFGAVSAVLVPLMAAAYTLACIAVLTRYASSVPGAFALMFEQAFAPKAIGSGVVSYTLFQVIQVGFSRGLFATDAGAGLEAIIHGNVPQKPGQSLPAFAQEQALVASMAPLLVTLMVTLTALVLLVTGVWNQPNLKSSSMCIEAFRIGLNWPAAKLFLASILLFYGATTLLTWSFCADQALRYLLKRNTPFIKIAFVLLIPLGILASMETVWQLGDVAFSSMLLLNLLSLPALSTSVCTSGSWGHEP